MKELGLPRAAALLVLGVAFFSSAARAADLNILVPSPSNADGPRINFPDPIFDFGRLESGQMVKHDFIFTNNGTLTLEITDARPSCGCTLTGNWDKKVEPGKYGTIPVKFNSLRLSGEVLKTVIVLCNDPVATNVTLQIKGTVWKPIDVTPAVAFFAPSSDSQSNEVRVVRIVNNLDEPLTLSAPECTNKCFLTELKTLKEGKEYELQVGLIRSPSTTNAVAPVT